MYGLKDPVSTDKGKGKINVVSEESVFMGKKQLFRKLSIYKLSRWRDLKNKILYFINDVSV